MTDPRRLLDDPTDPLARSLLASASDDGPSTQARARAAAALGSLGIATLGTTAMAASHGAAGSTAATLASASVAPGAGASTIGGAAVGSVAGTGGTVVVAKVGGAWVSKLVLTAVLGTAAIGGGVGVSHLTAGDSPASDVRLTEARAATPSPRSEDTRASGSELPAATPDLDGVDAEMGEGRTGHEPATAAEPDSTQDNRRRNRAEDRAQEPIQQQRADTLAREIAIVDATRTAIHNGDSLAARRYIDKYRRRFPGGSLIPAIDALELDAAALDGDVERTRDLRRRFLEQHPGDPLSDRVDRVGKSPGELRE